MNPLISIIVPVYNVEKYLEYCFNTLINQSYTNIEIVLVDDGSTDSSGALCDKLRDRDSRVRVIHKSNAGLGMARNSGLEVASGQYVMFVDSDDFVDNDMVSALLSQMLNRDADTSYCGYYEYYGEGDSKPVPAAYDDQTFKGQEVINDVLLEMIASRPECKKEALLSMSVWHALYSMKIINEFGLRFPSEREFISEDIIFDIAYLSHASCVTYIAKPLYYYRCDNSTSLTHTFKPDFFKKQKIQIQRMERDLASVAQESEYRLRLDRYFLGRTRFFIGMLVSYWKGNKRFKLYREVKRIINDDYVQSIIAAYPYRANPLQLRLINMCVAHKCTLGVIVLVYLKQLKDKRFR